jgi:hypothetical protein
MDDGEQHRRRADTGIDIVQVRDEFAGNDAPPDTLVQCKNGYAQDSHAHLAGFYAWMAHLTVRNGLSH